MQTASQKLRSIREEAIASSDGSIKEKGDIFVGSCIKLINASIFRSFEYNENRMLYGEGEEKILVELKFFGRNIITDKKLLKYIVLCILIVSAAIYVVIQSIHEKRDETFVLYPSINTPEADDMGDKTVNTPVPDPTADSARIFSGEEAAEEISVYVTGYVRSPGVYKIEKGKLVADAIDLAGGFKDEADIENINMVYILNSNAMLKIKAKRDQETESENSSDKGMSVNEDESGNGIEIIQGQGGDSYEGSKENTAAGKTDNAAGNTGGPAGKTNKVNINTASADELKTLPGIGDKKAADIIAYREESGKFNHIEDITKVSGIGSASFEKLKELIEV